MPEWISWLIWIGVLIYLVIVWVQFYRKCLKRTLSGAVAFTVFTFVSATVFSDLLVVYSARHKTNPWPAVLICTLYFIFPAMCLFMKHLANKKKENSAR